MSNAQMGRSMTEMLGVMALMGVLSVGFLVSYRYAMDKYKADVTLDEVSRRHVVLSMQYAKGHPLNMEEFNAYTQTGYYAQAGMKEKEIGAYYIKLTGVKRGVCRQIVRTKYPALIILNEKFASDEGYGCEGENNIEFVFVEGTNWCESMDEEGNCCDTGGRCCPREKPLIDSSGKCVSCIGGQTINVKGYEYTCDRCENRDLVGTTCALPCPEGSYRTTYGGCIACETVTQQYVERTPENIARVLACPRVFFNGELATHCDSRAQTASVKGYEYTCDRCENRDLVNGNMCALPCPDGTYRRRNGECIACETVTQEYIEQTPENIAKVLACPKVFFGYRYESLLASHCDVTTQSDLTVKGYEYTCDKCGNRRLDGTRCVLK